MNPIRRKTAFAIFGASLGGVALVAASDQREPSTKLTLQKRIDNGPYKNSAYSIRYGTQELGLHRNNVDLVYEVCGQLHVVAHGGSNNRIARAKGKTLMDVKSSPKDGWQESIVPEKGATYVISVDTEDMKMKAKLLVTDVSDKEVKLEWAPLWPAVEAGTKGQCGGPHEAK